MAPIEVKPVRAYYPPADPTSTIDASQSVSVEQLDALGWKIYSVSGTHDEMEKTSRKLAQDLGFPVTREGCIVPFNFDLAKNAAATMDPEIFAMLMRVAEAVGSDMSLANGAVVVITNGNLYIDVEDITAAKWVRIHLVSGMLGCAPTGAKFRLPINEKNKETAGIGFFKETISNPGLLVKKEIDNHPSRQAYLKSF